MGYFSSKNLNINSLLGPFSSLYSSNALDKFNYITDSLIDTTYNVITGRDVNANGFFATVYSGASSGQCPGPDPIDGEYVTKVVGSETKKFLKVKVKPDNELFDLYGSLDNIKNNSEKNFYIGSYLWAIFEISLENTSVSLNFGDKVYCRYIDGTSMGWAENELFITSVDANYAANAAYNFASETSAKSINFENNTGLIQMDQFLPKLENPDFPLVDRTSAPMGRGKEKGSRPGWRAFVIHYSVTYDLESAIKVLADRNVSYHYIIDIDGTIHQTTKDNQVAYHAKGRNSDTIGISFVNLGPHPQSGVTTPQQLIRKGIINQGQTAESAWISDSQIKEYTHWQPYTNEQIVSSIKLARHLIKKYPDPGITEAYAHSQVSTSGKMDPGPAFDLENWKKLVFSENLPTPTAAPATNTQSNNQNSNSDSSSIVDDAVALAESAFGAVASYFGS